MEYFDKDRQDWNSAHKNRQPLPYYSTLPQPFYMQIKKPTLVQGTRDFGASQVFRKHYVQDTIRPIYEKYGFLPLETPALENLATLTGKYGNEGEQLLYKVLNSGDFLAGLDLGHKDYKTLLPQIAAKGLRYDLTVPLMRYVAMNKEALTFPFRRYQMQPVWRSDRPQKGRYREFYQCDADIVGTNSLLCEAEILVMIHEALRQLGVKEFSIHLNHRGVLKGLAELAGAPDKEQPLCLALDKLDKIGQKKVEEELLKRGFTPAALEQLGFLFALPTTQAERWALLTTQLATAAAGAKGIEELQSIMHYTRALGLENHAITLDPTLARGLSYYTGTVFEVKIQGQAGSIGGGGRYDNLTDIFGVPGITGVGFSFGLDRLCQVVEDLNLFPPSMGKSTQVLISYLDPSSQTWALQVLAALRAKNIRAEVYPEAVKLKKMLQYAHKRQLPWVAIIGEEENATGMVTLKNMQTVAQQHYTLEALVKELS